MRLQKVKCDFSAILPPMRLSCAVISVCVGFLSVGLQACDREERPQELSFNLPEQIAEKSTVSKTPSRTYTTLQQLSIQARPYRNLGSSATFFRATLRFNREVPFRLKRISSSGQDALVMVLPQVVPSLQVPRYLPVNTEGFHQVTTKTRASRGTEVLFEFDKNLTHRVGILYQPYRVIVEFFHEIKRPANFASTATIVLDPGHGGNDFGARTAKGIKESTLALELAFELRKFLRHALPRARILLTRESDRFVSLQERVEFCDRNQADLLVSLHLNAFPDDPKQGGVATFVLDDSSDEHELRFAARENGVSVAQLSPLQSVLASLERKQQLAETKHLATKVQSALLAGARQHIPKIANRGVRSAPFYVLAGVHVPAILVEGSFVSNPVEAEQLETKRYRRALAQGIAKGIAAYLIAK